MQPDDRIPSENQLAKQHSVSRLTVQRAIRELVSEGLLRRTQGSGTFVGNHRPDLDRLEQQRMLDQIVTDMLARASAYGFTLDDVLDGLRQRKEQPT